MLNRRFLFLVFIFLVGVQGVWGQDADAGPQINSGDTAWILTATALVLFMTIPGLSMFYGGLVRSKGILSVLMQCFVITALMSVIWLGIGYSLSFSSVGMVEKQIGLPAFIGGFDLAFLRGVTAGSVSSVAAIPEMLFFAFQMTFFIITPALIVGAFVERIRFSALLWFVALWSLLVYAPVCHMVWGGAGGFLADLGVKDFAGGIVVHITAGIAALVACIVIGPREGYPRKAFMPHNLPMTVAGTGMLWVGWFGFNGGSAVAANGDAAMAVVVTHISASMAALTWMAIEWKLHGRPSVLGCVTGAVAGLAAITPASGFVGPVGALAIGGCSGFICWWASTRVKIKLGYDDSLDVFGVHGVGGILGTFLLAVFMHPMFGGKGDETFSIAAQFKAQTIGVVVSLLHTLIVTWLILKVIDKTLGLRVEERDELQGLDLASHGESAYNS